MRGGRLYGLLVALILATGLNGFAAGPTTNSQALGMLAGRDPAWVNNQPALPGTAFYPGDVITTGDASTLQMNFRTGVTATLGGASELALSHDASAAHLNLRRGSVVIKSAAGQTARVSIGATSVYVQGEGGFPAICRIAVAQRGITAISNDRGRVLVQRAGVPVILPAGKSVRLEAGAPQGGSQQAGKVGAAIPQEVIQRVGQTSETPLKLNDAVNWNDVIRTLKTGRVRVELLDGSTMNVGAGSTMRIVKHNAESQQTEIEMKLGRLRSEVVKLTKPNAKFEVTTSNAVIGVVGTTLEIHALNNITYIWCRLGLCTARNINPLIQGVASMAGGMFSSVPFNGPPSTPVPGIPGQLSSQMHNTDVGGGTGAPGGVGGAGGGFANAATFGSTAAGAGLAGGTASALSGASDSNGNANSILGDAASSANGAQGLANGASNSAGDVADGANSIEQHLVSPSEPGCNCH